ncbi:MAG: LysM peptidoglycan-binding domain-containing protein [Caldilineaceae bacterium]
MQTQSLKRAHRQWLVCSLVLIASLLVALMPSYAIAAPADSASYSETYYWVQPGDTLSEIAVWHGTTTYAIMQANGLQNPNHIYVGQKLYIPGGYGGGHHGGWEHGGHGGPVGGPQCAFYHTVQYGQTLSHIAAYYGVNTYTLAQVMIHNWNHVYAGQRLCIPAAISHQPIPSRIRQSQSIQNRSRNHSPINVFTSCATGIRWPILRIGMAPRSRHWSISTTSTT